MASTIGIKLANGEFYSILEENSQDKKRLVLTTVHDNQRSIQIDLYRSSTRTMATALYIGSLVMENIKSLVKGEPSIELVVASSENGDITADAVDLDSGPEGRQTMSVSLKSLEETKQDFAVSDFNLEDDLAPPTGLYEQPAGEIKKGKSWLPKVIIIALILLVIGLLIWFLLFYCGGEIGIFSRIRQMIQGPQSQASEQLQVPAVSQQSPSQAASSSVQIPPVSTPQLPPQPVQQEAPLVEPPQAVQQEAPPAPQAVAAPPVQAPVAAPPPVIQAPAEPPASVTVARTRPVPPVASYTIPSVIPREGVVYRIRYGDTLWDISEAFYRNPWLYPQIARFNNIRNPNLIISGTTIRVPPRN